MQSVIPVYKSLGSTPYQAVLEFKKQHPGYQNEKISYAGRLDPMAEGLLLLLVGLENTKRKDYEKLPKTYEFSVLLGVTTDSYDILGIPKVQSRLDRDQKTQNSSASEIQIIKHPDLSDTQSIQSVLNSFLGKRLQVYPPYSSKAVNGKPLYWWARQNRLEEIEIPGKEIEIYSLKLLSEGVIMMQDLRHKIQEHIRKVKGDFRQEEILKAWENFFSLIKSTSLPVINCITSCSSGTYVRGIAHEIGQKLDCEAIALSIKRTNVGGFNIYSIIKT